MAIDYALEAITEQWRAEIHEQSNWQVHEAKIGQHLLGMHASEAFDGFEFNQQGLFNDDVRTKALIDARAFEFDGNRDLCPYFQSAFAKLIDQYGFVCGFKHARAKPGMDLESAIDCNPGQLLDVHAIAFAHFAFFA